MTFAKFAAIVAAYRPDVEVTRHNGFQEQSGVGVVFKNGSTDRCNDDRTGDRRIYRYKGSYSDILNRLGIKVVTRENYESTRWLLDHAREQHGKISLFSGKPQDRSREIAEYEELLRRFESDEYVREWEFCKRSLRLLHCHNRGVTQLPQPPPGSLPFSSRQCVRWRLLLYKHYPSPAERWGIITLPEGRRNGRKETMPMHISPAVITTVASIFSSLVVIFGAIFAIYRFVIRQSEQDKEIKKMKEEQKILVYGVLACLRGLQEAGVNGPVTDGIQRLEKHLNIQAHE